MKAVFFSVNRAKGRAKPKLFRVPVGLADFNLKFFLKKYGTSVFLTAVLIFGMIIGSVYTSMSNQNLYNGLDFLFTTNLQQRLTQGFFETFCACFASNFVFFAVVFLLGITPWGIPLIPLVCAFKGFGAGLSGGYLLMSNGLNGFFFYFTVLLPGTFLFCMTLICQGNLAFYNSKKIFTALFISREKDFTLRSVNIVFLQRNITLLMITLGCAILDTLLWCLLAPLFSL